MITLSQQKTRTLTLLRQIVQFNAKVLGGIISVPGRISMAIIIMADTQSRTMESIGTTGKVVIMHYHILK